MQRGDLVYGAELAFHDADIGSGPPYQIYDRFVDLKARVGYASGNALVYGVLGYSTNRFDVAGIANSTGDGIALGLGVDVRLGDRFIVGAEYLRRELENEPQIPVIGLDSSMDTVSVRGGLTF